MEFVPRIPNTGFDSTLALLLDPYQFISKRCKRYGSDLFQTRIMLRKTVCMSGPQAAELFYDESRILRKGAMPSRIQKTLLGEGGVQGLDGEAHRQRKQMFTSLMTRDRIRQLGELSAKQWEIHALRWAQRERVVLYHELHPILTRAVCAWAGVPLAESEVALRTRELTALFDSAGSIGPKHWWARLARKRAERWIEEIIGQIRSSQITPPEDSAAHAVAWHRDLHGKLLSPHVAAVELLNILRPTVAVSVFIVQAAHALHVHPEHRPKLLDEPGYAELFSQEVRRFYPFFPAVMGRVRQDFEWKGYFFPRGRRVMLDLYGTNHDPRVWDKPETFCPERFLGWQGSPFHLIPQGGGDYHRNHRCPGEWIALELIKVALNMLTRQIQYSVPNQDLRIEYRRLPALPKSRFVMDKVQTMLNEQRGAG